MQQYFVSFCCYFCWGAGGGKPRSSFSRHTAPASISSDSITLQRLQLARGKPLLAVQCLQNGGWQSCWRGGHRAPRGPHKCRSAGRAAVDIQLLCLVTRGPFRLFFAKSPTLGLLFAFGECAQGWILSLRVCIPSPFSASMGAPELPLWSD